MESFEDYQYVPYALGFLTFGFIEVRRLWKYFIRGETSLSYPLRIKLSNIDFEEGSKEAEQYLQKIEKNWWHEQGRYSLYYAIILIIGGFATLYSIYK